MVGIGGSHSKTPSTSSLQHAAQHSHPPRRSGQPPESPQFSTSLPSPIGGGGRASNSSFSAQSQQHSKHPSRLPKLSLNTRVSPLPRPSTKPLLVSSPSHTQPLRDSKHSQPTNGSNIPQPDPSPVEGRCSCGSDFGTNPDCGPCWAHRRAFEQLGQSHSVTAPRGPTCSLCGTDVDVLKDKNRCRKCYHKYESPADFLFGRAHAPSGKK